MRRRGEGRDQESRLLGYGKDWEWKKHRGGRQGAGRRKRRRGEGSGVRKRRERSESERNERCYAGIKAEMSIWREWKTYRGKSSEGKNLY